MGGGASILAASGHPGITAVANLATANTNPSAIEAAPRVVAPALMFSGSLECVTPPGQHQIPICSALGSPCRARVTLEGASHCQLAEYSFTCGLGEGGSPAPTISRQQQHALTLLLLQPWLDFQLKGIASGWTTFQERLATTGGLTYEQSCPASGIDGGPVAENVRSLLRLRAGPNPLRAGTGARSTWEVVAAHPAGVILEVWSPAGRRLHRQEAVATGAAGVRLGCDARDDARRPVPSGVYLYRVSAGQERRSGVLVIVE